MLKKTTFILIASQIAFAGALYAGNGAWFDSAAPASETVAMKGERPGATDLATLATSTHGGAPIETAELAVRENADPCAKAAWPHIPAECLTTSDGAVAEDRGTVRRISF
jgi:hypothetical protein